MKLAAVLIFAASALAQPRLDMAFTATGPIRAGNTVRIKLTLTGSGGLQIAGLQAFPRSSAGGTFVAVDGPANIAAGKASTCATVSGQVNCLDTGMNTTAYADGIVKFFDLAIPSNATPGQASVTHVSVLGADVSGNAVAVSTAPLTFTLASPISPCDLDGDGTTTIADVTLAKNMVLGLAVCSGDLDGDGFCAINDVQRVVAAALGGACRTGR